MSEWLKFETVIGDCRKGVMGIARSVEDYGKVPWILSAVLMYLSFSNWKGGCLHLLLEAAQAPALKVGRKREGKRPETHSRQTTRSFGVIVGSLLEIWVLFGVENVSHVTSSKRGVDQCDWLR